MDIVYTGILYITLKKYMEIYSLSWNDSILEDLIFDHIFRKFNAKVIFLVDIRNFKSTI